MVYISDKYLYTLTKDSQNNQLDKAAFIYKQEKARFLRLKAAILSQIYIHKYPWMGPRNANPSKHIILIYSENEIDVDNVTFVVKQIKMIPRTGEKLYKSLKASWLWKIWHCNTITDEESCKTCPQHSYYIVYWIKFG